MDGEHNAQETQCAVENKGVEFHISASLDGNRNQPVNNSMQNYTQGDVQLPLSTLDFQILEIFQKWEESQIVAALDSILEQTV